MTEKTIIDYILFFSKLSEDELYEYRIFLYKKREKPIIKELKDHAMHIRNQTKTKNTWQKTVQNDKHLYSEDNNIFGKYFMDDEDLYCVKDLSCNTNLYNSYNKVSDSSDIKKKYINKNKKIPILKNKNLSFYADRNESNLSNDLNSNMRSIFKSESKRFTGFKDFSSDICSIIMNDNVKEYICSFDNCFQKFPTLSRVKRHFLLHTDLRPFKCPVPKCSKIFSRKDNMLSHLRKNHKEDSDDVLN